jgi:hypothetical protein
MVSPAMSATCGTTCGITRERERQKEQARQLARRVSELLRGELPAWADDPPFGADEPLVLGEALGEVLPCWPRVVAGAARGADWIELVVTLSDRSWTAFREGLCEAPEVSEETVLRVGLSPWGRYATLQESKLRGSRDGDGWWIEEERLAGVEDRRLAMFVKGAQGLLRARKIVALDAAFLSEPVDDDRSLWQCLFDADPMVGRSVAWVPARAQRISKRRPARRSATL